MLMQSVYSQLVKVIFQRLGLLPWKQRLTNQVFKKYMTLFADLLALKVNINQLNAIKNEHGSDHVYFIIISST